MEHSTSWGIIFDFNGVVVVESLLQLNAGLVEFLEELQTHHIPITIATATPRVFFTPLFAELKLGQWFELSKVVCGDDVRQQKPAPDKYVLALKNVELEPENCVVFEDTQKGIASAHGAGIRNIIVVKERDLWSEFAGLPGVVRGIENFTEISYSDLVQLMSTNFSPIRFS